MNEGKIVRASMIVIGNEILSGRTQDINLNYLARGFSDVGIVLGEARIVADDEAAIVAAVNQLRARYDPDIAQPAWVSLPNSSAARSTKGPRTHEA